MHNKGLYPEIITNYNVYKGLGGTDGSNTADSNTADSKLLGVGNSLTLPTLTQMTETISGSGILGEYEAGNVGHFNATDIEIPFVAVSEGMFDFDTSQRIYLTIRATQQSTLKAEGTKAFSGVKVQVGGDIKELKLGKFENGKQGESSITLGLTYIKIEISYEDGTSVTALELDKFNEVFVLNGVDQLASIKKFS